MDQPKRLEQKGGAIWIAKGLLVYIEGSPEELVIPEGVTELVILAEWDKKSLKRLVLPKSLKKIPDKAFQGCSKLEEIVFSEGLESIGDYAFSITHNLKTVTFPESLRWIGDSAFSSVGVLHRIQLNPGLVHIGDSAFSHAKITELEIPESVREIGFLAFAHCRDLRSVRIPASVQSIHPDAFCSSEAVTIYTAEGSAADRMAGKMGISVSREETFFRPVRRDYTPVPSRMLPGNVPRLRYETLAPMEKECYLRMVEAFLRMDSRIDLLDTQADAGNLHPVLDAIELDYPQIFWVDWFRTKVALSARFSPGYWISKETQEEQRVQLEKAAEEFLSELPDGCGEYEMAQCVLRRLCEQADIDPTPVRKLLILKRRDSESSSPWTAYGALVNRKAISVGGAAGCQYLLQALGMECIRWDEWKREEKYQMGGSRVLAKLDGEYYILDAAGPEPKMELFKKSQKR